MPSLPRLTREALGTRICVAIAAASVEALAQRAATTIEAGEFVELRLDALPDPPSAIAAVEQIIKSHPSARVIATCRRLCAGGGFAATAHQELAVLRRAAEVGCLGVDLALETAEELTGPELADFRRALHRAGAGLLISHHDYQATGDLEPTLDRIERYQPDAIKVVSTAQTLDDNIAILRLLSTARRLPVLAIAMGEAGIVSRVLGPRSGGLFTFASADDGAATAPGQVTASALRELYRIDKLGPLTRVFGVAGMPIAQSLSPLMQNQAFAATGVDAVFLPLPCDEPEGLFRLIRELPLSGASITMPLKQAVLSRLDWVDPVAARVGACNTIVRAEDGSLCGYNTDVAGVVAPLQKRLSLFGAKVLVRGAGGAARAAVFGLREKGAEVWIANRTQATAEHLALQAGAHIDSPEERAYDVLVNAIPSGMQSGGVGPGSKAGSLEEQGLNTTAAADLHPTGEEPLRAKLVFDMVYNPVETPLIRQARSQGVPVITGIEMFVHQGARQFELWTGRSSPEAAMAAVVVEALKWRERTR